MQNMFLDAKLIAQNTVLKSVNKDYALFCIIHPIQE